MIPYEKLSAALDAHRRRVRGEPEPQNQGFAEPEVVDASELVAAEDDWIEPAGEQVQDEWSAQPDMPPVPPAQPESVSVEPDQPVWEDGAEADELKSTSEWQDAQPEAVPPEAPEPFESAEPMPLEPEEAWPEQAPAATDEYPAQPMPQPEEPMPEAEEPPATQTAQQPIQDGTWDEPPPISPEDFAEPEPVADPSGDDEWAVPTVPPAPPPAQDEGAAVPEDNLPPPPADQGTVDPPPATGQPNRTIFGMPAPPTQPPAPPDEPGQEQAQGDDLVIVDDEPNREQ